MLAECSERLKRRPILFSTSEQAAKAEIPVFDQKREKFLQQRLTFLAGKRPQNDRNMRGPKFVLICR